MPRSKSYDDDSEPVDPQEEAYKRAGLAASNAELAAKPQGFFESFKRLGEGNIDQPGSEAYNKYGAGRGRSLEAARSQSQAANTMADDGRRITARQTAASEDKAPVTKTPSKMPAYPGRSADRLEDIKKEFAGEMKLGDTNAGMGRRGAGESNRGPVPNAMGVSDTEVYKRSEMDDREGRRVPTAKTAPIVTKEELAASGMTLREYLNEKQGLKPRGGSAPSSKLSTPPPGSSNAPSRVLMPNKEGQPGGSVTTKRPRGQGTVMEQGRGVSLYGDSLESLLKKDPNKKSFFKANDERIANLKKGGSVKKMSTGGSASSRADGIAQRGKTKGKFC